MIGSFSHRKELLGHKIRKKNLVQSSLIFYIIFIERDHLGSIMDRRKGPMGHMVVGLNRDTSLIGLTQS